MNEELPVSGMATRVSERGVGQLEVVVRMQVLHEGEGLGEALQALVGFLHRKVSSAVEDDAASIEGLEILNYAVLPVVE